MYQTIGLPNLLNGRNAPDIYFEWVGNRLLQRDADGFAADLTEQVESGPLAGVLDPALYNATTVDGKILMVPHIADVSNVIWYNVDMLAEHDVDAARRPGKTCSRRATRSAPPASCRSRRATRTSGRPATGSATSCRASSAPTSTTRR